MYCASPVVWCCRIHWLYLCGEVRPASNKCPGYDSNQWWWDSSSGALGMWSSTLLLLLPGLLWPGTVVPVKVPSMGQIELFNHLQYLKPFKCVQTND